VVVWDADFAEGADAEEVELFGVDADVGFVRHGVVSSGTHRYHAASQEK
jgi:hypothetical protein